MVYANDVNLMGEKINTMR